MKSILPPVGSPIPLELAREYAGLLIARDLKQGYKSTTIEKIIESLSNSKIISTDADYMDRLRRILDAPIADEGK